ncbi:MAG: energy-coupling factor ABC transporter permease [Thermoleophilia bacterium]
MAAIHVPEGLIPATQAVAWYVPALAFVGAGLRSIKQRFAIDPAARPLVGLMGAFVFVISLMPVPVPGLGTVSHPCGTPLAAILLGPLAALVLGSVALLLQAVFFAHGGLTSWGANVAAMAVAGSFAGYGTYRLVRMAGLGLAVAAGAAGMVGDLATYGVTSLQLSLALHGDGSVPLVWATTFTAFLPTQLPLAVAEGLFTAGVVMFIARQRAELLQGVELRA